MIVLVVVVEWLEVMVQTLRGGLMGGIEIDKMINCSYVTHWALLYFLKVRFRLRGPGVWVIAWLVVSVVLLCFLGIGSLGLCVMGDKR